MGVQNLYIKRMNIFKYLLLQLLLILVSLIIWEEKVFLRFSDKSEHLVKYIKILAHSWNLFVCFHSILFDLFELHIFGLAPNLLLSKARFVSLSVVWPRSLTSRLGGRLLTAGETWSCFCRFDLESLKRVSCNALLDLPSFCVKTSLSCLRARFSWTILSNVKDPTENKTMRTSFTVIFNFEKALQSLIITL